VQADTRPWTPAWNWELLRRPACCPSQPRHSTAVSAAVHSLVELVVQTMMWSMYTALGLCSNITMTTSNSIVVVIIIIIIWHHYIIVWLYYASINIVNQHWTRLLLAPVNKMAVNYHEGETDPSGFRVWWNSSSLRDIFVPPYRQCLTSSSWQQQQQLVLRTGFAMLHDQWTSVTWHKKLE